MIRKEMKEEEIDKKPVFAGRIDIRKMAALARFFVSARNGPPTITRSELLSEVAEALHDILLQRDYIDPILTYEEAVHELERVGISFGYGTPAHKTIVKLLQDEHIERDELLNEDVDKLMETAKRVAADIKRKEEKGT